MWPPLPWGNSPQPGLLILLLGPFAGLVTAGWTAQNEAFALRCIPVALASTVYPAIVFWIWPRWTEQAGSMRAIALAVAALLWCGTGFFTAMMTAA